MIDDDVLAVLRAYPQIYLACHVEHRTRRSSDRGLTSRDSSFLAHIDEHPEISPAVLANHLGIGRPSLSAALNRLQHNGLIEMTSDAADARRKRVQLTALGREAITKDSVLDAQRVRRLLDALNKRDRQRAIGGLSLLAAAAQRLGRKEPR